MNFLIFQEYLFTLFFLAKIFNSDKNFNKFDNELIEIS